MGPQAKQLEWPVGFKREGEALHETSLEDRHLGDRHDELCAPAANIRKLSCNFVP
jgi:hypothetical protein